MFIWRLSMKKSIVLSLTILSSTLALSAYAQGIWTGVQGNAAHTGFVNIKTDPANFHVLWSKQIYENKQTVDDGPMLNDALVTNDKLAFFDINYLYAQPVDKDVNFVGDRLLMALDQRTGELVWTQKRDPAFDYTSVAYDNNKVVSFRTIDNNSGVDVIDPDTGNINFSIPLADHGYLYNGLLAEGGKIYPAFSNDRAAVLYSLDSTTGKNDWMTNIASSSVEAPLTTPQYLIYSIDELGNCGINAYDRTTGKLMFSLTSRDYYKMDLPPFLEGAPIYDAAKDVVYDRFRYAPYGQSILVAFDLTNKKIKWSTPLDDELTGGPVLAENELYTLGHDSKTKNTNFRALDTETGQTKWTWQPKDGSSLIWPEYSIATANVIFIHGINKIYGISRQTHQQVWEYNGEGDMAIGNNILFIMEHTYRQLPKPNYGAETGIKVTAIALTAD